MPQIDYWSNSNVFIDFVDLFLHIYYKYYTVNVDELFTYGPNLLIDLCNNY